MKTRTLIVLCLVMALGGIHAVANARQVDPPASPSPGASVFLPLVAKLPAIDLTITRLEVSQAIQTPVQSVPLVANRPTIVRVYLQAIAPYPINGVTISFAATRLGVPIAGSPLIVGQVTAPLAPAVEVYASTVNVTLPDAWRSGNVTLAVTADPSGAINETNETNNQRSISLAFNVVPALDLKIVPIAYHDTRTGRYIPAAYADPVSDFVRRTFPLSAINVTYRVPQFDFWGDLSNQDEWVRLLVSITDLKPADGAAASQVYYGLVPNGGFYYPNIRGIGWIGLRAAVGVAFDSTVGAHEIGHTFDRLHTPCGDPLNPDPSYPYPNASIGYYGIDVYSNILISPAYPNYAKDLMSYCSPQWVSDYTYVGLYNDQRAHGQAEIRSAPSQTLLIRARFNGSQAAELLPVYSLEGFPDNAQPDSDYAVELIGLDGEVIATYPVRRFATGDLEPPAYAIYAAVPQPSQPVSKVCLVHAGAILAERPMIDRVPAQAPLQALEFSDKTFTLTWGSAEVPVLVRYSSASSDQRVTLGWSTLGLDVLGGKLPIDRTLLPEGALRFEVIPADASSPVLYTLNVPAGGN